MLANQNFNKKARKNEKRKKAEILDTSGISAFTIG
jgi:hypothetical protein